MKIKCIYILLIALLFSCLTASAQSWLWADQNTTGLKSSVTAKSEAVDKEGDIYQVGNFETSIMFGAYTLETSGGNDYFLVKYDSLGNVIWAKQSKTISTWINATYGYSVAVDDSGNSYITGAPADTTVIGPDTLHNFHDVMVVKYDPAGNVIWVKQPHSNRFYGTGWSIATDKFGHEYVTGYGCFLIKFDNNGDTVWTIPPQLVNGAYVGVGYTLATDPSGDVFLSGEFSNTLQYGTHTLYSATSSAFLAKFDSNGECLWANQSLNSLHQAVLFNNSAGTYAYVSSDITGASYITGYFSDTVVFGPYWFSTIDSLTHNFYIIKYNSSGSIVWAKAANTIDGSDWGSYSVSCDDSCHIFISGAEGAKKPASFLFDNDTFSVSGTIDDKPSFLLKLDSSGNMLCGSTLKGGGDDPSEVISDSSGKLVYLGGDYHDSFYVGNTYLTDNNGSYDDYMARWQPCYKCDLLDIAPQSASICAGQHVNLAAQGGTNYTWSPATGLNTTTGDSVVANPTVTTTYTVTESYDFGCAATDTVVVIIIPSPNKPTFTQHNDTLISSSKYDNQWYRNDTLLKNDTSQELIITDLGEYWVIVNNEANGCSTPSDSVNITSLTGIEQLSANNDQFSIYPNPTNGEITISSSKTIDYLKITDLLGQLILQSQPKQTQFTVTINATGMYFVTVTLDNETVTKKVVVVK